MDRKLLLLLIMIASFCGCNSAKNRLCKVWFFTHNESGKVDEKVINMASFLYVQPDGKYTAYLAAFESGTWELKDQILTLISNEKKVTRLNIRSVKEDELQLMFASDMRMPELYTFDGFDAPKGKDADNPFSARNNQWRVPPARKESDEEIAERLRNHFHFWEKYFSWGIQIDKSTLNVRSTPTLLKLYGNGFELKPFDQLPEQWMHFFYDTADCQRANDKMHTLFTTDDIDWPETKHRYKLFIAAFQQLQQKIK